MTTEWAVQVDYLIACLGKTRMAITPNLARYLLNQLASNEFLFQMNMVIGAVSAGESKKFASASDVKVGLAENKELLEKGIKEEEIKKINAIIFETIGSAFACIPPGTLEKWDRQKQIIWRLQSREVHHWFNNYMRKNK